MSLFYISLLGSVQIQLLSMGKQQQSSKKWSDFISDLWHHERLRVLMDDAVPFVKETPVFEYDPETGLYGYQYGSGTHPQENEELFIQSYSDMDSSDTSTHLASRFPNEDHDERISNTHMDQRDSEIGQQPKANEIGKNYPITNLIIYVQQNILEEWISPFMYMPWSIVTVIKFTFSLLCCYVMQENLLKIYVLVLMWQLIWLT